MIRNFYNNSIIAYKTGTRQTVNLVLETIIKLAKKKEKVTEKVQLHSDKIVVSIRYHVLKAEEIEDYIEAIDDSLIRQSIRLHYIDEFTYGLKQH